MTAASDPDAGALVAELRAELAGIVVGGSIDAVPASLRLKVYAWIGLVESAVAHYLQAHGDVDRDEVVDFMARSMSVMRA